VIARKIARRYAKALMNIGQEDGKYEQYGEEFAAFTSLVQREKRLRSVLSNPTITIPQRQAIIKEISQRLHLSPLLGNLLHLLVEKNRIQYLADIELMYRELADAAAGRARVKLETSHELSPQALEKLARSLEGMVGKTVIMEVHADPSLIGGVVARMEGMVFDGSIRTQLERLREALAKG
jgi:F-type H+-transporting ATPase subunit delta